MTAPVGDQDAPGLRRGIVSFFTLLPDRRPALVLGIVFALTVLFACFIPRVRLDSSMETIFHADDPETDVYADFKKEFGEDEIMIVALRVPEGDVFNHATLSKIRRITRAIEALPDELGVDRVFSLTNVDDVWATEDGFSVNPLIKSRLPEDEEALRAIRERAFDNPLYVKNLVSEDGRAAAITIWLENWPGNKEYKEALFEAVRAIVKPERNPEEFHFAGIPVLTAYTSQYLRVDILKFIPLTIILIGLVLFYNFRSLAGVVLPLATVGLAVVWMAGMIGILGRSISIVSSVVPSIVLACGIAEVIHVLGEYYRQDPDDPLRLEKTLRHIFAPVFVAGITTVCGFGAMLVYDVPQIFEFGLYSAMGIFFEMLLAMFFVPAALYYLKPRPVILRSDEATGKFRAFLIALARFDTERPKLVLGIAAVSLGIGIAALTNLRIDTDYASYFKPDSPPVQALNFMRENISGERRLNVVIKAPGGENAALMPEVLKHVEGLEDRMREHPLIGTTLSIVGYLKNMNRAMHGDDEAQRVIPRTQGLAYGYLGNYGRPNEIRRFLSEDKSTVNVIGRSSIISSEEFLSFMDDLRDYSKKSFPPDYEVTITGSMYLLSKASIDVAIGQALSFGWADLMVFTIMFLLFRSVRIGLISMVPNVLPIVWCYGLMAFVDVPLSTGTSVIAAMALGIVVDDTVHMLARYQDVRRRGLDARESITQVFAEI
ncbi:MAG: efflux RND transporter permease subunit, partial [Planctomycetota bacterium]